MGTHWNLLKLAVSLHCLKAPGGDVFLSALQQPMRTECVDARPYFFCLILVCYCSSQSCPEKPLPWTFGSCDEDMALKRVSELRYKKCSVLRVHVEDCCVGVVLPKSRPPYSNSSNIMNNENKCVLHGYQLLESWFCHYSLISAIKVTSSCPFCIARPVTGGYQVKHDKSNVILFSSGSQARMEWYKVSRCVRWKGQAAHMESYR